MQFFMNQEHHQRGSQIAPQDEVCTSIMFIVRGKVELTLIDDISNEALVLDRLQQGDCIGQYSVLFEAPIKFAIRASTYCSIIRLDWDMLREMMENNEDLVNQFNQARDYVDKIGGVPMLDYKKFRAVKATWREKLKETVRRAKIITKLNKEHSKTMIQLMRNASNIMRLRLDEKVAAIEDQLKKKLVSLKAQKLCHGSLAQMVKAAKKKEAHKTPSWKVLAAAHKNEKKEHQHSRRNS